MPSLIGNGPNQVPTNADLGSLAQQDANSAKITGGFIGPDAGIGRGYYQDTNHSDIRPALLLDFSNSKQVDSRIYFVRNSSASVYQSKKITKGAENKFRWSTDLSNSIWQKYECTVYGTGETTAPDGSYTAFKVIETTTSALHELSYNSPLPTIAGLPYIVSFYAKAGERTSIAASIRSNGFGSHLFIIDLSTGTVSVDSKSYDNISASATSVGNGWYRIVITGVAYVTSSSGVSLYIDSVLKNNIITYSGTYGSGFYVWGFQLEQRDTVTAYTPTGLNDVVNYISGVVTSPINTPRIDYDPITSECKGLLIESQITNYCPYSNSISSLPNFSTLNVTSNVTVAPDGTVTASKLAQINGTPTYNYMDVCNSSTTFNANQIVTMSLYAKKAEAKFIRLNFPYNNGAYIGVQFDLEQGTVTKQVAVNGTIYNATAQAIGDGWYRCILTATITSINGWWATITPMLSPWDGGYSNYGSYGDGVSGIYVWGAQVELNSYASSLIVTNGAQATRAADYAVMVDENFSSWYNQSEGTFLVTNTMLDRLAGRGITVFNSLTGTSDFIGLGVTHSSMNYVEKTRKNNITNFSMSSQFLTQTNNIEYTSALAYKEKDAAWCFNGGSLSTNANVIALPTSTVPFSPPIVDMLGIGNTTSSYVGNAYIKKIAYYPVRLSNDELLEMTL